MTMERPTSLVPLSSSTWWSFFPTDPPVPSLLLLVHGSSFGWCWNGTRSTARCSDRSHREIAVGREQNMEDHRHRHPGENYGKVGENYGFVRKWWGKKKPSIRRWIMILLGQTVIAGSQSFHICSVAVPANSLVSVPHHSSLWDFKNPWRGSGIN